MLLPEEVSLSLKLCVLEKKRIYARQNRTPELLATPSPVLKWLLWKTEPGPQNLAVWRTCCTAAASIVCASWDTSQFQCLDAAFTWVCGRSLGLWTGWWWETGAFLCFVAALYPTACPLPEQKVVGTAYSQPCCPEGLGDACLCVPGNVALGVGALHLRRRRGSTHPLCC